MNSSRKPLFPRLLMPSNIGLPPVEYWRGTSPNHAAKFLPFLKSVALLISDKQRLAVRVHTPGIVWSS
jgi:hypothetical protein